MRCRRRDHPALETEAREEPRGPTAQTGLHRNPRLRRRSHGVSGQSPSHHQENNVYDKLRLLNGGQPWSTHASAWYVPSAAAAAAVNAFSQHMNGQNSPSPYNSLSHHDHLNENQLNHLNSNHMKLDMNNDDCKKG